MSERFTFGVSIGVTRVGAHIEDESVERITRVHVQVAEVGVAFGGERGAAGDECDGDEKSKHGCSPPPGLESSQLGPSKTSRSRPRCALPRASERATLTEPGKGANWDCRAVSRKKIQ